MTSIATITTSTKKKSARKPARRVTKKTHREVKQPSTTAQPFNPVITLPPAEVKEDPPIAQEKKLTHSYRLFECLKRQNGVATTEELAVAAGLKPYYVSWYMAELKRVYGVNYEHKRGEAHYRTPNLEGIVVPPHGVAGMRRGQQLAKKAVDGKPLDAETVMADAIMKAQKAIQQEFDRLRASLGKVKVSELPTGEVRVASIPWDAWLQMKHELEERREVTAALA